MGIKNVFILGKSVIFILVLSLVVSMYWHYRSFVRQQSLEKSNSGLQANMVALQGRLRSTQKTLSATEQQLQELLAMDWQDKAILQETRARDWQKKYQALELEQDNLLQEQTNMKHQYEIDLARMERGLDFQSNQNNKLRGGLIEKDNKLDELAKEIVKHESSISELTRTITDLENKLHKQMEIINQKAANISSEPDTPPTQNTYSYRQVRLESLKIAMTDQDSKTRRIILTDVIPTIPDGVNSDEFISLVAGMDSQDILNTIRKTEKYISRPFDNKILGLLSDMMDKNDANEAVLILSGHQ